MTLHILLSASIIIYHAECRTLMWGDRDPSNFPPQEQEHFPEWFTSTLSPYINGTEYKIANTKDTPDYRIEEPPYFVYNYYGRYYEEERPYRISPHHKQTTRWPNKFNAWLLGCYCTTVYKKFRLLAGCAVLTSRHIITSAMATDHILKRYKPFMGKIKLDEILGAWLDWDKNDYNTSIYMIPVRIHYHPKFMNVESVNVSHPIPSIYDISVWASQERFPGRFSFFGYPTIITCQRAASGWFSYVSSTALAGDTATIVGFQFIKAYRRKPMPWYKYAVRTKMHVWPCPKTEWGWYHCIKTDWAKLGLDIGAGYQMTLLGKGGRNDGLAGLNAFSMNLRAKSIISYFTVLDTYPVLDFLHDAYLGYLKCEWIDYRFLDVRGRAPVPLPWYKIPTYDNPEKTYYNNLPYYK